MKLETAAKLKAAAGILLKRVLPAVAGLVFLILVIAWLAGVMVEKIEPGPSDPVVRRFDPNQQQGVYEVYDDFRDYTAEAVGTLKAAVFLMYVVPAELSAVPRMTVPPKSSVPSLVLVIVPAQRVVRLAVFNSASRLSTVTMPVRGSPGIPSASAMSRCSGASGKTLPPPWRGTSAWVWTPT